MKAPELNLGSAAGWAQGARQNLSDALLLAQNRSWRNAYLQAGMAVEFALKARIMHVERLNAWPSRRARPDLHSHKLNDLMRTAQLAAALEIEVLNGSKIGSAWMTVKDFDINVRYPTEAVLPRKIAEDFVKASHDLGLVEWLMTGIL